MGEIIEGVIHGKTIELAGDPGLQDGAVVETVIRRVKQPRTWGEGIRTTAGALGRMPREDFADLEEIVRGRQRWPYREVAERPGRWGRKAVRNGVPDSFSALTPFLPREWEKEAETAVSRALGIPTVSNHGGFGRRAFLEVADPYDDVGSLIRDTVSRRAVPWETLP